MAIDTGADGVEFDVQLAKDGVPVVIHDTTLKRTAGRAANVADLTSDELAKSDVGSWFNNRFPHRARVEFESEGVPTLESVLALHANKTGPVYIELKCDETNFKLLAAAVCEVIRDSPMLPRMIVKSFRLAAIPEVRCLLPTVQTAALFEPSILTILRGREQIVALAREFGADQLSLHKSLATSKMARLAAEAKMPVTVWTADNTKWIDRCRRRGIGSLITNDLAALLRHR